MPTDTKFIPFLTNFGLFMTYKCQVQCPHCIVQAGPHRKEQIRKTEALEWLQQLAGYDSKRIRILALTGGEPFYDIDLLKDISDTAQGFGLTVTAVTNAFWAGSVEKAVQLLKALPAISNIAFSTDIYHQECISLENIRNAVAAAVFCKKSYLISVCTDNRRDAGYLAIMEKLLTITDDAHIRTATALPLGRALTMLNAQKYDMTGDPPIGACTSDSPIIFPDGRVVACIGPILELTNPHPLLLGDLSRQSIKEILDKAQTNVILHAIRVWGPHKLVAMVKEAGLGRYLPEQYIETTICDTCYKLMSNPVIVEFLNQASTSEDWQKMVAYGRKYYLEEPEMMEALGLVGECPV